MPSFIKYFDIIIYYNNQFVKYLLCKVLSLIYPFNNIFTALQFPFSCIIKQGAMT